MNYVGLPPRRVLWAKVCEMEGGPRLNQGFINELTNLIYIASNFPFCRALLATSSWYKFALWQLRYIPRIS